MRMWRRAGVLEDSSTAMPALAQAASRGNTALVERLLAMDMVNKDELLPLAGLNGLDVRVAALHIAICDKREETTSFLLSAGQRCEQQWLHAPHGSKAGFTFVYFVFESFICFDHLY